MPKNSLKWSIQTKYNGTTFRSKTEAIWAQLLDEKKMPWMYEPFTLAFPNDVYYIPDFWLPDAQQYLEIKGVWDANDLRKLYSLWRAEFPKGISIAIGELNRKEKKFRFGIVRPIDIRDKQDKLYIDYSGAIIVRCKKCRTRWFAGIGCNLKCRKCGAYNTSELHLSEIITQSSGMKKRWLPISQQSFWSAINEGKKNNEANFYK